MSINAQIIDQHVRKIVADQLDLFPAPIRRSKDERQQRSAAFVVMCMARVLDIPPAEAVSATFRRGDLFEKLNVRPGALYHML